MMKMDIYKRTYIYIYIINITPRPDIILRAIEFDSEKTNDEILLAIYENELEKNDKFLDISFQHWM